MNAVWLIQRGSSQFSAPDAATVEEWASAGRIAEDDYVYNPMLGRWLLARETPEFWRGRQKRNAVVNASRLALRDEFRQESNQTPRKPFNAPLFIFVGLGVLVGVTMIVFLFNAPTSAPPTATAQVAPPPSAPPDTVELGSVNEGGVTAKRTNVESLVATMIEHHVIVSISPDRFEAQVSPAFWDSVDLTAKRGIVITIAEYCKIHEPSTGGAVTIKSSHSGRKLAEYSVWSGVKIAGED